MQLINGLLAGGLFVAGGYTILTINGIAKGLRQGIHEASVPTPVVADEASRD